MELSDLSVLHIIEIYLEHFQKNRQTFNNKLNELDTRFKNIPYCKEVI